MYMVIMVVSPDGEPQRSLLQVLCVASKELVKTHRKQARCAFIGNQKKARCVGY